MERVKKSNANKLVASGKLGEQMKLKAQHKLQISAYQGFLEELKKREPYIDFETEVLPNLQGEYAYIFKNHMLNPSGDKYKTIAKKIGYSGASSVYRAIVAILKKIDRMIERKAEIKKYIDSLGGEDSFQDLCLFLNDEELKILNEVILSLDFHATNHFSVKHADDFGKDVYAAIEVVNNKFKNILERKAQVQKFIKSNGGEDFLVNEFGVTLSDENFYILLNYMMDYHYTNDSVVSEEMGQTRNYLCLAKQRILNFLAKYKAKKAEVDQRIERAGGVNKVTEELYSKLSEVERRVFEEYFLVYDDGIGVMGLREELHIDSRKVARIKKFLQAKLDEMTEANQKERK